jgi:hypothetical protein
MKLKSNYVLSFIYLIISITSVCSLQRGDDKNRENKFVDPLAIHIALGQTQQQTQG